MEEQKPKDIPAPRLRCVDRERQVSRPSRIDDLIDETHQARIIWAFMEGLDLSELYGQVKSVEGKPGSPAIDVKLLMAIWLYAIIDHETSARRIADLCKNHNAYTSTSPSTGSGTTQHRHLVVWRSECQSPHPVGLLHRARRVVGQAVHFAFGELETTGTGGFRTGSARRHESAGECWGGVVPPWRNAGKMPGGSRSLHRKIGTR